MIIENKTVFITGGSSGIGKALALSFVNRGNTVIVCGRDQKKLDKTKAEIPEVNTVKCDVSDENERSEIYNQIMEEFKRLDILVNNAGIQRKIDLTKGLDDLLLNDDEIEINFRSQVYLTARFVPILSKQKEAAIVNVSSGLGFVPLSIFPIYSATKAAIHSYTMSLRHQLKNTPIKVFELIPPTVYDTNLKGKPIEKTEWTVSSKDIADATMEGLTKDTYQITVGASTRWVNGTNEDRENAFDGMNH
jgi:uncharacterized oxidoreductase